MTLIKFGRRELSEDSEATASEMAGGGASPAAKAPFQGEGATQEPPNLLFEASALREAGLLSPSYEGFKLAREYRHIKRPLIARAFGRGTVRLPKGYLIMVASAVSGEGKSFTAVNLALSLSLEKDLRVLLVDADVVKPQISRVLGLSNAPGLLDVLREPNLDVERVIRPTNIATLSVLPAGKASAEATELLASQRMEQVVTKLGEHDSQRIVLFDSPPLLQTNESQALAQLVGQVVVVVQAESTPQPLLLDALEILKDHPGVSLVLNRTLHPIGSPQYYGYGSERSERTDSP
jgi:exopolysaccharide/PEP-CTERM locus tyrosine autokinase